jgi:transcriptional regulator with XRE-family HTH domain
MYEIFERLLQEKGLKAADVTRATGIKSPVFSEWKKGKSKPNTEKMIKIAKFLDVSVEYLTTGEDSRYSTEDALLIKKYYSLDDRKKKHVLELIDLLSEK